MCRYGTVPSPIAHPWRGEDRERPIQAGLLGVAELVKATTPEAVARLHAAGLEVVLLSVDNRTTAEAVGKKLGIDRVLADVLPHEKADVVRRLKTEGRVVAMAGDGVNDAPALKRADIGVAMGVKGTEVAKEAADMVLTDDNFAALVAAVEQGRVIYANILRFVHYLFSCNLSEILVVFAAILVGWPLPLAPLQVPWLNLITDVFPALALGAVLPRRHAAAAP